jgi:hypothetical protein
MRKFLLFILLSFPLIGFSQTREFEASQIPDSINYIYIENIGFKKSVDIIYSSNPQGRIEFTGLYDIDLINYLSLNGWIVISQNNGTVRITLLKREKPFTYTK